MSEPSALKLWDDNPSLIDLLELDAAVDLSITNKLQGPALAALFTMDDSRGDSALPVGCQIHSAAGLRAERYNPTDYCD
ncbi:hypothetical protein [Mycobacterium sp. PSTR-4-N]|uniref:hypothetical protein n=1 Tax=Mycobacterium sp. PSTR-4-N TaxID=2917745 RepID=UPI001F14CE22|nr:hypothetical protein [Mycobacterium sp. PSTR-4-N]MCG7594591.1 hypothetical protein [Mycobacterium sp. PSTR-4-N]